MKRIAIIGAGYAGLSAAYDLARAGHEITILEASDQVGGLASGFKDPDWAWSVEKFYHHWFASDEHMLGLIDDLELRHKVRFPRPFTVLMHNEKWYPFDSITQALLFPGLGWGLDKIRFGLVGLYLRLTKNWRALEKTTVDSWMRKWAGDKVYTTMWEPMMVGKFGPYHREVNMAWFWARIHARTTKLGTYEGGFQAFADEFADKLKDLEVQIQLNSKVTAIHPETGNTFKIRTGSDEQIYDQVLVTVSPQQFAEMTPDLSPDYLQGLRNLKSMGAVVLTLALKKQLSEHGYYWFNLPKDDGFPFLALVEHTNYLSPAYFGGDHIIYCGDYCTSDHEYFNLSEDELLARFTPALKRINPQFEDGWVRKTWLHRTEYGQPVPLVNHAKHIPAIKTPLDGLYFASMSQVYPWDRGTNYAVEIGRRAARQMMDKNE
ncbi:MAG: NAD(P)/FAD-dependent oxidoreductase [Chloroflexota bacterium]